MKKAKSTKAIDITTMQPVKLKSAKKEKKPLSNQPDYLNALSKAQKMPKQKTNFSTEKFVNVEDGNIIEVDENGTIVEIAKKEAEVTEEEITEEVVAEDIFGVPLTIYLLNTRGLRVLVNSTTSSLCAFKDYISTQSL